MNLDNALMAALDGTWRPLRELRLHPNTKLLVPPAQRLQKRGLVESKLGRNFNLEYRLTASGTEARRAGTVQQGPVHEGAAREAGDAQNTSKGPQ